MLRASAAAELAGVPTSSLVCEGFLGQAATTASGLGMPNLPVAPVPGHVDTQPYAELERNIIEVTLPAVLANLTAQPDRARPVPEPGPTEVVFRGSFEEVNRLYQENRWSDGLPVVPPTREAVERFLAFTDLDPDHSFGPLLPDKRAATVWSVAVNGVMAGCRPEYLPVLLAVAEALADPAYGVEHSGNTPGAETLITVNGPIARRLGFNDEQGVLRDGFVPNTTVGRFLRLYLRNVAGFLPWQTDKGTYGNTWRVAMAENEAVLAEIGWPPLSSDHGFAPGTDAVTISRYTGGGVVTSVFGQHPDQMVDYLADALAKIGGWEYVFSVGLAADTYRPLVLLTPVLARTIAAAGWSRDDLKQALWERARIPARRFERYLGEWTNLVPGRRTLEDLVNLRKAHPVYRQSTDPERLVPIVADPAHIAVAVTGDPLRTNAYVFAHNGMLGFPTAKAVRLPADYEDRLAAAGV
ncbi:MAG: UGSC family (seleno)protein [Acidimicrobiia bacterium]